MMLLRSSKSLEDSIVLIDEITETIKQQRKKSEGGFIGNLLVLLVFSLVQPFFISKRYKWKRSEKRTRRIYG